MGVVQRVTAIFENRGDTDWFRVHLVAGTTYQVQGGNNLLLEFVRPDGQPMTFPIPYSNYANFVAPVTGDYFISATALGVEGIYSITVEDVVDPIPASIDTPLSIAVGETLSVTGNNNAVSINDDWFAIDVVAGQSYVLATDDITGSVYIADGDGDIVAIEGAGNGGQQVHFTATETGRYYAGAQHFGGSEYELSFLAVADDHGETPASAGNLAVGTPVNGVWESGGDDDAYAVALTAGSSYNFAVQNLDSVMVPGFIRVLDQSGAVVWTSVGQASAQSTIFSPLTSGTYYVSAGINDVASADPTPQAYLAGWDYSLGATAVAGDFTDNVLTTGLVLVGDQAAGTWDGVGDRDWLRVDLTAGQSYAFTLATGAWNGAGLALFDAQGNVLNTSPGNTNTGAVLHHTAAATGTYFLGALSGVSPGSYTVSVAAVADDFVNNATTTGLVVAGAGGGVWEAPGDQDWFAADLTGGVNYLFGVAGGGGLVVRDAQGNLLTQPDLGDVTFMPSVTGRYYLEAMGDSGVYTFTIAPAADDYREDALTTGVLRHEINGTGGPDTFTSTDAYEYFFGLGGDDLFIAGTGYDRFDGSAGIDTVTYGGSAQSVDVNLLLGRALIGGVQRDALTGVENVVGSGLDDIIVGSALANAIAGGAGNDQLSGFNGNDILNGGTGVDRMIGGLGDDTSYADDAADTAEELAGQGRDIVYASVNYALHAGTHVEVLSAAALGSTDPLQLSGNELNNEIYGNAGANVLRGGGGSDLLLGGYGDDIYYITSGGETIFEYANEGRDIIYTGLSHGLAAGSHVEILSAISLSATDPLQLSGNELNQEIYGNAGANVLRGGGGSDLLLGGFGDDTYYITSGGETIFEYASEGRDIIYTDLTHGLAAGSHVEILSAISLSSTDNINLGGNELDNYIYGNAGSNILYGGGGVDTLVGGLGNDNYYILGGNEILYEDVGGGRDTAYAFVSYTLTSGAEVDILSASSIGATDAMNLTGNEFANGIFGNAGINTIDGKGGGDYLVGGGGVDTFAFTTALGAGNVDTIADFQAALDKIALDDAVFTGLAPGALAPGAFVAGPAAGDADDRIVYNSATGQLFFDADGNGAGAAVQFASVAAGTILTASDFTVI